MSTFKDRLVRAMKEAGIPSQRQLAFAARLRPSTITRWVSGETKTIRPNDLGVVCSILGVRPEWLLLDSGPMKEDRVAESEQSYSTDALDAPLLGQCFTAVLEVLDQRGASRPPAAKIGAIVAEVYALCQSDRKAPTTSLVAPFIRVLLA